MSTRGVLLFAFDNDLFSYYDMAVACAKRVNHFLNLPVTLVTNEESLPTQPTYTFDRVTLTTADKTNHLNRATWINKGRYQAFDFSPYDETILLDADYLINSRTLLRAFDTPDFCFHNTASFLMEPHFSQEKLGQTGRNVGWATVVGFKKTLRAKRLFECMEMVQKNYDHYANLYGFINVIFRNDYAISVAGDLLSGHMMEPEIFLPWNLTHVSKGTRIHRMDDTPFCTDYLLMHDIHKIGKTRSEYILVSDTDFHLMDKTSYMELIA